MTRHDAPERGLGPGPLVISLQSQVAFGAVGHGASLYAMQALGARVACVPTVLLSNHPRYPTLRGGALDPALVADLLRGIEERGLVEAANVVLTGYLGSAANGAVVAGFLARARARNPRLICLCDPVIGDDGPGVFVEKELIAIFRDEIMPLADVATPNLFELELLAGTPARDVEGLGAAARRLARLGPKRLAVTSARLDDTPAGEIETALYDDDVLSRLKTPRLPIRPNGAGDLFAGLLAARLAAGEAFLAAAEAAVKGVFAVLARTLRENSYELVVRAEDVAGA
ncbi:pyridoxal kinase [Methylocella sp.]|uniref:pyridoxal kinase n=1 Tax=Methylocella sp. TaxID=1978226 RepID=UPI00378476BE